jgi:hypothetical protein
MGGYVVRDRVRTNIFIEFSFPFFLFPKIMVDD